MQAFVGTGKGRWNFEDSQTYLRELRRKFQDAEAEQNVSVLLDSDILIEVSRGRDQRILTRWTTLGEAEDAICILPLAKPNFGQVCVRASMRP